MYRAVSLLDATHPHTCPFIQVSVGKNDSRVLSAEFKRNRGEVLGGSNSDLVSPLSVNLRF